MVSEKLRVVNSNSTWPVSKSSTLTTITSCSFFCWLLYGIDPAKENESKVEKEAHAKAAAQEKKDEGKIQVVCVVSVSVKLRDHHQQCIVVHYLKDVLRRHSISESYMLTLASCRTRQCGRQ
ncbi:hypothetical protein RRG08_058939 [Elysia crispata]|uniref:Uncharacterized protein n=1 Tax=Elysia crispata TaxID=231223 RepID=A0AAE0XRU2_9GAST|nr:hypothetical protein RRG08_058939 [Elysia crispata]